MLHVKHFCTLQAALCSLHTPADSFVNNTLVGFVCCTAGLEQLLQQQSQTLSAHVLYAHMCYTCAHMKFEV